MTSGTNDTRIIKTIMGARLKKAREEARGGLGLTRQELVDILNSREDRPVLNKKASISIETLKQWEYGNNPINVEWIPVICKVLDCDVGFLFGEYPEKRREISDACKFTGLSETVIERFRQEEATCRKKQFEEFLLNDKFWEIINCFHKWRNVSKGILEEKRKQSDMFMELVKSGQYPEESELFWRVSNILDESVRSYEIDKYYCSRLFDEIRDIFLPNV